MYRGEVKVAESSLEDFLKLGKILEVKGLCTLDYPGDSSTTNKTEESSIKSKYFTENKILTKKTKEPLLPILPAPVPHFPPFKKRKIVSMPSQSEPPKATSKLPTVNDSHPIPRPPNAFMLFACQWRTKLAVEYPNENPKEISIRLGNMWKGLSHETKDAFYEDARKAEEEHRRRFPR